MSNPPPPGPSFPAMHLRVGYADGGSPLTTAQLDLLASLLVATDGSGNTQRLSSVSLGPDAWLTADAGGVLWLTNNAYLSGGGWYAADVTSTAYALTLQESGVAFLTAPFGSGPLTWNDVGTIGVAGFPTGSAAAKGLVQPDGITILVDGQGHISVPSGPTGFALYNDNRITGAQPVAQKNIPFGYAPLDGSGLVPLANLPSEFTPASNFAIAGVWNASTNAPTLASSTGTSGQIFVVGTAGSTSLNGSATWDVNDWAYFTGGQWHRAVAAQQTPYQAPFTAAVARSIPSRLAEKISVLDFMSTTQLTDYQAGTALVDQSTAFNAAINYVAAFSYNGATLAVIEAPPGQYLIQHSIILKPYVELRGYGAVLIGAISAYPYIATGSSPAAAASSDAVGQTGGGCFSDNQLMGGPNAGLLGVTIRGFTINNFRYGICTSAFQWILAEFVDNAFNQVNIAYFAYQAMQAWHIENPKCIGVNAMVVVDATCFTADNPVPATWGGNVGSYVAQLRIEARLWQQNCLANPAFDAWFEASILRPTTASVVLSAGTYNFASYVTACNFTGRAVSVVSRNHHGEYTVVIDQLWVQQAARGAVYLANAAHYELTNIGGEGTFNDSVINAPPYTEALVTLGDCTNGIVRTLFPASTVSGIRPLAWVQAIASPSGYGYGNVVENVQTGVAADGSYIPAVSPIAAFLKVEGEYYSAGDFNSRSRNPAALPFSTPSVSTAGNLISYAIGGNHRLLTDEITGGGLAELFLAFRLPSSTYGSETIWQGLIPYALASGITAVQGTVEIWLRRMDNGNQDYGHFPLTWTPHNVNELTLASNAAAGQPNISLGGGGPIGSLAPGANIGIGSDNYVVLSVNDTARTAVMTSNLVNSYAAGTALVALSQIGTAIAPFTHGWTGGFTINNDQLRLTSTLGTGITLEVRMLFKVLGAPLG